MTYDEDAIKVVTPEILQTPQGRRKYWQFLKNHPTIEPIRKIYGINAPRVVENGAITKHVKQLCLLVHPDKVAAAEQAMCTEIFTMLQSAQKAYTDSQRVLEPMWFGRARTFSSDPKLQLLGYMEQQKWVEAKNILAKIDKDALTSNPHLACLCMVVLIRLGEIEAAVEYGAIFSEKIAGLLKKCSVSLAGFENPLLTMEAKKQRLLESLGEMRSLRTVCQEELQKTFSDDLPKLFVPYQLYAALKSCCLTLNDFGGYEKHLREAIRFCPREMPDKKQPLVEELKIWIRAHYQQPSSMTWSEATSVICQAFTSKLQDVQLFADDSRWIINKITQFIRSKALVYLNEVIQHIQNIIDKCSPALTGTEFTYFLFAGNYSESYGNLRTNVYPPRTINQLKAIWLPLRGLKNYAAGDKQKAASDFLTAQQYFFLGLLQLEFGEYAKAIESWRKVLHDENDRSPIYDKSIAMQQIFIAINLHDTNPGNTQLAEVDELQELSLKTFFIPPSIKT